MTYDYDDEFQDYLAYKARQRRAPPDPAIRLPTHIYSALTPDGRRHWNSFDADAKKIIVQALQPSTTTVRHGPIPS